MYNMLSLKKRRKFVPKTQNQAFISSYLGKQISFLDSQAVITALSIMLL